MMLLKQSTSVDVVIGPFLDDTDGKTPETGLTITQPDVRLKKNGGAWAQKNAAQTLTHEENGNYEVTLDATDTNTLGHLRVHVSEAGALPVWQDYVVVPANVYDSIVGGSDFLEIDVNQWKGATAPAMTGDAFARLGAPAGASVSADVAAVKTETASIQSDTNDIQTRLPAALVGGRMDSNVSAINNVAAAASKLADNMGQVIPFTVQASSSATGINTNLTEATNDHYRDRAVLFLTGVLAGQALPITAYNGTTKQLTVTSVTSEAPGNGDLAQVV